MKRPNIAKDLLFVVYGEEPIRTQKAAATANHSIIKCDWLPEAKAYKRTFALLRTFAQAQAVAYTRNR